MDRPIIELRRITKSFGWKVANKDISLSVFPGSVHAIVGENGAGKTTLMSMISGTLQPDHGDILIDGEPVAITDPRKADSLGIGMVYQHFHLVPSLTVASNIFLGRESVNRLGQLDRRSMDDRVTALSDEIGLRVNPRDRVQDLSLGERQRVEIVKALSHHTRLLILDEPTAMLTPAESDELFVVIRRLATQGCAVLFISHKLGEVLAVADDVSVLRDGQLVGTTPAAGLSQTDIAKMMVGREVLLRVEHTPGSPGSEVLSVEDLSIADRRGAIAVKELSLHVRAGEIVGIAGVEGNGQSELAAAIAGMVPPSRGSIKIAGIDVTTASVARRREIGLGYIPEDRVDEGVAPSLSVMENIAAGHLNPPISKYGWLFRTAMARFARRLISNFDVRGATPATTISTLSGGNMQKVVLAREFASNPLLLLVSQPTRGVDVGAMEFVHNSLIEMRDQGSGVLLISADLNEVMSLSDRLIVMYRGSVVAEFTQASMTELAVGLAMAGTRPALDTLAEAEAHKASIFDELEAEGMHPVDEILTGTEARENTEGSVIAQIPVDAAQEPLEQQELRSPRSTSATRWGSGFAEFAAKTFTSATQPITAVLIALVIGGVIIALIGRNPLSAYIELFTSAWRTPYGIGSIIAMFVPLSIMAAGTIISFRSGFFNIGGEGQLYFGAFFGAYVGFTFHGLPPIIHIPLALALGTIAGGLWGLIPGALFAYLRVDIVVSTLLLSEVAMLVTNYFVTGPFADTGSGILGSPRIDESARLPIFDVAYGFGPDLFIAIAISVILGLVLNRSRWGLRVREMGELNRFADYIGTPTKRMSMQVTALSGAVAGFAGALFVIGPNGGRFLQTFSPGFAFLAITVALLARLNPSASLIAALFYATMMAGGTGLQAQDVPFPMVNVLQGLIIIAITATFVLNWRRRARRHVDPPLSSKATSNAHEISE